MQINNIWLVFVVVCLYILPSCKWPYSTQKVGESIFYAEQLFPQDLLYTNKPIPNARMKELVPILCSSEEYAELDINICSSIFDSCDEDEYEWHFIGTLPYGQHLVYCYWWPNGAMGKFTQIVSMQRTEKTLTATPLITGGDRHATMIDGRSCHLKGNVLRYDQLMTNGLLYAVCMEEFPALLHYAELKNTNKIYWGEADYLGYGTYEVTFGPDAKILNKRLISFTPVEDIQCAMSLPKEESSLSMGEAINAVFEYYASINTTGTFSAEEINKIMLKAFSYAE